MSLVACTEAAFLFSSFFLPEHNKLEMLQPSLSLSLLSQVLLCYCTSQTQEEARCRPQHAGHHVQDQVNTFTVVNKRPDVIHSFVLTRAYTVVAYHGTTMFMEIMVLVLYYS